MTGAACTPPPRFLTIALLVCVMSTAATADSLKLRFRKSKPLRYKHEVKIERSDGVATEALEFELWVRYRNTGRTLDGGMVLAGSIERAIIKQTGRKPCDRRWTAKQPFTLELVVGGDGSMGLPAREEIRSRGRAAGLTARQASLLADHCLTNRFGEATRLPDLPKVPKIGTRWGNRFRLMLPLEELGGKTLGGSLEERCELTELKSGVAEIRVNSTSRMKLEGKLPARAAGISGRARVWLDVKSGRLVGVRRSLGMYWGKVTYYRRARTLLVERAKLAPKGRR